MWEIGVLCQACYFVIFEYIPIGICTEFWSANLRYLADNLLILVFQFWSCMWHSWCVALLPNLWSEGSNDTWLKGVRLIVERVLKFVESFPRSDIGGIGLFCNIMV